MLFLEIGIIFLHQLTAKAGPAPPSCGGEGEALAK